MRKENMKNHIPKRGVALAQGVFSGAVKRAYWTQINDLLRDQINGIDTH